MARLSPFATPTRRDREEPPLRHCWLTANLAIFARDWARNSKPRLALRLVDTVSRLLSTCVFEKPQFSRIDWPRWLTPEAKPGDPVNHVPNPLFRTVGPSCREGPAAANSPIPVGAQVAIERRYCDWFLTASGTYSPARGFATILYQIEAMRGGRAASLASFSA